MTPVSKKFAPKYATPHSLVANQFVHSVEKALKEQKEEIVNKLMPEGRAIIKDLNEVVDENLKLIVLRINRKNELLKKQRDLQEKLQKRNDEIRSLHYQQQMFEQ